VLAYAVFGITRVDVGGKGRVVGDVGCLLDEASIGKSTHVTGAVAAPTVALARHASATGGYFCATVTGATDACMAIPNPLVDAPTIVIATPGNLDVSASRRTKGKSPLAAGAYGKLSAGTASQVMLAGGTYQFESITVGARAKVLCLAACDVTVHTTVTLGGASQLGAADGVAPSGVVVRVAGSGTGTAFTAKSRARVFASVYAPSGDVKVGSASRVTGALVGSTVSVGARARLTGPSGG
jgi:hypothetical protein